MKLARWPSRQVPPAEVLNLKKPYLELQMKRMELVKRSLGRCSHLDETVSTLFLVFKVNLLSLDLFCFFLHFLVILLFQEDCLNSMSGENGYLVVMAAGWFCEKSGWIGKVEDVKPVLLKKNGFQPATILRRRIFTRMNCEIGGFHPVWFI